MEAFSIRDFGATGNGESLDTGAIQAAVNGCAGKGGGTVLVPPGVYLTGGIVLKDNVTLHIAAGATLLGSTDLEQYHDSMESLICAHRARNVRIEGGGTIDGQGAKFDIPDEFLPLGAWGGRPRLVFFRECQEVQVVDVTLKDSSFWAAHFLACRGLKVRGLTIDSYVRLNNDGIDIDSCEDVLVSDCVISCGDDAIALKNGIRRPCRNVAVTNCIVSTRWAAFRIGPESCGGFENIAISNCVVRRAHGCGVKLQMWEGSFMRNIAISNLVMDDVTGPICIRLSGWERGRRNWDDMPEWSERGRSQPFGEIRNVMISHIEARVPEVPAIEQDNPKRTVAMQPGEVRSCISVCGSPGHLIKGITLSDIHVVFPGGGTREEAARRDVPDVAYDYPHPEYYQFGVLPAYGCYVRHARGVRLNGLRFETEKADLRPAVVCNDVEEAEILHLSATGHVGAESLLRLRNTRRVSIHGCLPIGRMGTFLTVEGSGSQDITLSGNDLRTVISPVRTGWGADEGCVRLLG